jgi:hypothetical protein
MWRSFDFKLITDIEGIPASHTKTLDIVAIVASVGETEKVSLRKSRLDAAGLFEETQRRYITLID